MKIQFLGTGAAEGVPAVFCNCKVCKNIRIAGESEFHTRSQVLIDGCLSIDFPPDAYYHSLKFNVPFSDIRYLLVTHSHMDHFYAHDFILRGYKYAEFGNTKLSIYGNSEVGKVFGECTAREMKPEVCQYIEMNVIKPYSVFNVGEYKVIAVPANHSKTEEALLFYIEKVGKGYLHLYDTGNIDDNVFDYLAQNGAKANLACFDCTFLEQYGNASARHMGIDNNMETKKKLIDRGVIDGDTKIIISHFSHNGNPTREKLAVLEKKYGVTAAFDGYKTEI